MADLLDSEVRRTPAWVPLVLLAALGTGVGVDQVLEGREVDSLLRRAAAAERTADYADRLIAGLVQYAGSQRTSPSAPAEVRADLQRLVAAEAAGQVPALRHRAAAVETVDVLPWHRGVRAARAAAVVHARARVASVTAVAEGRAPLATSDAQARTALARVSSAARADRVYD